MKKKTPTVVIGASLGGVEALQTLVSALPADFPAAVLMVLHVGNHPSILPELLSARGPLKASHAIDGEPVRAGHIHVAPPDHHLLVDGARLRLTRGPKEHHSRPAIDPLFRSAALESGPMVVGVVLTGRLDDGTAGLQAIKECGGIAVVQTPEDAVEPSMPASALKYVRVDHCVPLAQMAGLLVSLIDPKDAPAAPARVERLVHEHELTLSRGDPMEHLEAIAKPSAFVCPDCKGGLWEVADSQPVRYLCHTGHAFTIRTLQHAQAEGTEAALWGAIRALQERRLILRRMEALQRQDGDVTAADRLQTQERQLASQVDALQRLVERMPEPVE
ncbi:MAG: chemotaxis protein CheB [Ramlibacter sp.]|nr:chemotaxis protein CheB [Ramlibacter sp.]